ncbi:hypothetical protein SAMN05216496_5344 [Pseudomonas sp. Z003-0.4C(8344-21)]|nr:hypothetical protein SAMN05216496_5344 [Pseudomonas sp. Z003-0.4C(8344-21)]
MLPALTAPFAQPPDSLVGVSLLAMAVCQS